MPVNKNEITKAQMLKAIKCKTADELLEFAKAEGYDITKEEVAKAEGYDITKEEAEAYFAEISDMELDSEKLKKIAGGIETCWAVDGCSWHC